MTMTEQKQAQRQAGVAARKALSAQVRSAADAAICAGICQTEAYRCAGTLLVYAAWGGEVGLSGFDPNRPTGRQDRGLAGLRRRISSYSGGARPGGLAGQTLRHPGTGAGRRTVAARTSWIGGDALHSV